MKFFVALAALSAVIVLASAAPQAHFAPYGVWPAFSTMYGGGGAQAASFATGNGGVAPSIGDAMLGISNPNSVLGPNFDSVHGYNPIPVVWN